MTIIKTPAYRTEDGITHASVADAQAHALDQLIAAEPVVGSVVNFILSNKDAILAVLTSTGRKPRKRTKATKPKKPKTAPAPISTEARQP